MPTIEACHAVLTVEGYRIVLEWYPDDGLQRAVMLALAMIKERPVKAEIKNALEGYKPVHGDGNPATIHAGSISTFYQLGQWVPRRLAG